MASLIYFLEALSSYASSSGQRRQTCRKLIPKSMLLCLTVPRCSILQAMHNEAGLFSVGQLALRPASPLHYEILWYFCLHVARSLAILPNRIVP